MEIAIIAGVFFITVAGITGLGLIKRPKESYKVALIKGKIDKIIENFNPDNVASVRDSIVRADNLLASALQYKLNNTLGLGENLKAKPFFFKESELNEIWEAHKLRNLVVHEDKEPKSKEAKKTVYTFRKYILKTLK